MKKWHYIIISLIICLLDQLSKYFVLNNLEPYSSIAIMPAVDFTLVFNTGSAFSFLSNSGSWHLWFFLLFSLIMSVVIFIWIMQTPLLQSRQLLSLSFILGGAVGNLIDRIHYGHVIDFIDLYYNKYHWPAFNIADSAICIGAIILLFSLNSKNLSSVKTGSKN